MHATTLIHLLWKKQKTKLSFLRMELQVHIYIYIYTKKLKYDLYKCNCSYNKQFLKFSLPAIGIQLMSKHHPRLHFGQLYH